MVQRANAVMKMMKMTLRRIPLWLLAGIVLVFSIPTRAAQATAESAVDWSQFLARHDLVWSNLPNNWESGAFIGNGLLGAMIYSSGTNVLQWDVGRSDVTDKGDRVAIGRFVLNLPEPQLASRRTMRLDLWNALASGQMGRMSSQTPDWNGVALNWRSFTHASKPVTLIEYSGPQAAGSQIAFQQFPPNPARAEYQKTAVPKDEKNPDAVFGHTGDVHWCLQKFKAGGGYVVAWGEMDAGKGLRAFYF